MTDLTKLARKLAQEQRTPRASVFELTADTDADLITDQEKELLEEVAEGRDPFEKRLQEREQEGDNPPLSLHFSSHLPLDEVEGILLREARKHARKGIDPHFGKKHPELHKFLLKVHKGLKDMEKHYREMPEDPMETQPRAPRNPYLRKLQKVYRELQIAFEKFKEHYLQHQRVAPKWVKILEKRYAEFEPIYRKVLQGA